jgi:hypothetical protein
MAVLWNWYCWQQLQTTLAALSGWLDLATAIKHESANCIVNAAKLSIAAMNELHGLYAKLPAFQGIYLPQELSNGICRAGEPINYKPYDLLHKLHLLLWGRACSAAARFYVFGSAGCSGKAIGEQLEHMDRP